MAVGTGDGVGVAVAVAVGVAVAFGAAPASGTDPATPAARINAAPIRDSLPAWLGDSAGAWKLEKRRFMI